MAADLGRADVTLIELLRARAIGASSRHLAMYIVGGAIATAVIGWRRPPGWTMLGSASLCMLMYGAWSVAERHVQSSTWDTPAAVTRGWRALRAITATVGVLALFSALASVMVRTLGRWIS